MVVDINELVRRYEESRKNRANGNKSAQIRQIVEAQMKGKQYVRMADVVKAVKEQMKDEIPKEQVYQRVRQVVQKSYMFGMDEEGFVVIVKSGDKNAKGQKK